jgi:transcriptional antiterminator RfaH
MLATLEAPIVQRPSPQKLTSDAPPMLSPELACTAAARDDWFAVETENRFEKSLAWKLLEAGLPYYLPLVEVVRRVAHFKRTLVLPLFPNYLFVAGAELSPATMFCRSTRGVLNILRVPAQRQLRRELASIEIALHANPSLEVVDIDSVGLHVRVTGGAFEGLEGYTADFYESRGMARVIVQVEMLGKGTPLDIDRSDLELIP